MGRRKGDLEVCEQAGGVGSGDDCRDVWASKGWAEGLGMMTKARLYQNEAAVRIASSRAGFGGRPHRNGLCLTSLRTVVPASLFDHFFHWSFPSGPRQSGQMAAHGAKGVGD